ncbi:uncharacterized protein LOC100821464 [Brachypodium distachyon]|nr:uncharacterized protein LOC100821464 [Brachypodium distachyon]KQJ84033.1 hypothetical protein BRADI_5g18260v3 [Brachypodium distachyon]PNT61646.1 hypothetical protein BRADI_5g18260v3 [Brachypodium distachyon]PNT61647.1 hypothetical protein BRADI_5g18260v3 [Brachypodium distachyon]PNT61648.1 hypothetical protein BRADI_5g18260v3 [Brachypodium distachyon]PNT61650.1 hypothetical protein BRADI_5g18260v3 [Brachypodium distachyon]|eukprot:XP_014751078.1 uncharacterized protein LOC100821464 [Brachypodium distachyon]
MAFPAYSITRAEINGFWRRKETEEEERRLAAEKEAARTKAKALKMEDYMLFEQMIREILKEGNEGDGARRTETGITKNSKMVGIAASGAEARIGIKHWWKRSTYAYLNEPAVTTSTDENGRTKHAIIYFPQERCVRVCSSVPTASVIF